LLLYRQWSPPGLRWLQGRSIEAIHQFQKRMEVEFALHDFYRHTILRDVLPSEHSIVRHNRHQTVATFLSRHRRAVRLLQPSLLRDWARQAVPYGALIMMG